jgi:hypothetical protein
MKSIIQTNPDKCYLCHRNGRTDPLEVHHVFFAANRKWSEKFGLTVHLCGNRCHRNGENAVHRNAEVCRKLQKSTQRKAMAHYGWSVEQFRAVFGRNYLDQEES